MVMELGISAMGLGNTISSLVRANVIGKWHGYAFSIGREHSELLRKVGIGDRAVVHVVDVNRPVSFRAVMRLNGNRFYIHIPKWACKYYNRGDEAILLITPLR